ncbi:hypothetical protein ACWATR_10170 [Nostoc sp. UIC 10890]
MINIHRFLKAFIPICLTLICIIVLVSFQQPDNKLAKFCVTAKPLTKVKVNNYDINGIALREGTFTKRVSLNSARELKVIIFPKALSFITWSKVRQSSIQYIGQGVDNNWKEWFRPDYFYLLEVPPQATALAFGRLCYRNGDVDVEPIKNIKQISSGKIIINDKIYLSVASSLPKINLYNVIVNTGSNRKDALGTQTEVYFTTILNEDYD